MSPTTTTANPMGKYVAWFKYLTQSKTWVPKGKPALPIADMDAAWRHNAANWLLKRAKTLTTFYTLGEIHFIYHTTAVSVIDDGNGNPVDGPEVPVFAPMGEMARDALEEGLEEAQRSRGADPEGWLRTTPLYQALVKDLPGDVPELPKHWSTCDLRTGNATTCSCADQEQVQTKGGE